MPAKPLDPRQFFDLGHQGDVDVTMIENRLRMTPTQRWRQHERWRGFLKRAPVQPDFLEEMVRRLVQARVEFVIVGGMSAILQGSTLVTLDLDLCYRRTPDNIARLVSALAPLDPRPRGFPPELPFVFDERTLRLGSNFTLEVGTEGLDLLGEMTGLGGYEQIIGQAKDMLVGELPVKVLSLEQLIVTKEAVGRPKDLIAIAELKTILKQQQERNPPPA